MEKEFVNPDSRLIRVSDKISLLGDRISDRLEKLAPQYRVTPQSIPPSVLKKMEVPEIVKLAEQCGHQPSPVCDCAVCKGIRKMFKEKL